MPPRRRLAAIAGDLERLVCDERARFALRPIEASLPGALDDALRRRHRRDIEDLQVPHLDRDDGWALFAARARVLGEQARERLRFLQIGLDADAAARADAPADGPAAGAA